MDSNNVLGEVLEKGQTVVQKTGKAASDSASNLAKTAAGQVAGDSNNQSGVDETNATVSDQQAVNDKAQTEELVKGLYAPSKPQNNQDSQTVNPQSEQEKQAELARVRQKLHDEVYYQPLVQGKKAQEERPAEKIEKEKKQELQNLQKKEAKKPPPIAVQRAQQTAEKFRGVSG